MNATDRYLYFSALGFKGGSKRKYHPKRIKLAQHAAKASWSPESAAKRAATIAKRKHDASITKM